MMRNVSDRWADPQPGNVVEQAGVVYTVELVDRQGDETVIYLGLTPDSDLYRSISREGYLGQIRYFAPSWQRESRLGRNPVQRLLAQLADHPDFTVY